MCCAILSALQPMVTTQLMRTACIDVCWPLHDQRTTTLQPLRMNWVVVTDDKGNRQLGMSWRADRDS